MVKKNIIIYVIFDIVFFGAIVSVFSGSTINAIVLLLIAEAVATIAALMHKHFRKKLQKEKLELQNEQNKLIEECQKNNLETIECAKKQISEFHSQISHGLRIPISVVHGYADLLCGDLITDEDVRREYLGKICNRISYIDELFGRIIAEERMSANLPELVYQEINILGLIWQVSSDMDAAAQKKGIEINVMSIENKICILGDQTNLTKAFYNIIENALKYMGKSGRVDITVSRTKEDKACITFIDNGNGLSEEETNHIFEKGFQGANHVEGSGMGLCIVKKVVLDHGGEIFARSSIGRGMSVFLFLPIRPPKCENVK